MRTGEEVLLKCWGLSTDNQTSRLTPITCSLIKQGWGLGLGVAGGGGVLVSPRRL